MTDDSPLAFPLPAISRKKVTAAFDGGRLSSDSGVILLSLAERRRQIAKTLAALIADPICAPFSGGVGSPKNKIFLTICRARN